MKDYKLLAEKHLLDAAARYMPELDEKVVVDPDTGAKYNIDDETLLQASLAGKREGDQGDTVSLGAADLKTIVGDKAKADSKAAYADRFATRAGTGAEAYAKIADKVDAVIAAAAKEAINKGVISYNERRGTWEICGGDTSLIKKLLLGIEGRIYKQVIQPLKGSKDYAAILAAYKQAIHHQNNVGGKKDLAPILDGIYDTANETKAAAAEVSEIADSFVRACANILAEKYANRYDVSLDEATKMFILDDMI